jgi:hypothetical protein
LYTSRTETAGCCALVAGVERQADSRQAIADSVLNT